MPEARFCSNCRGEIPIAGNTCPECGVFAGDVFDGKPGRPARHRFRIAIFVLILAVTAGAGWLILQRRRHPELLPTAVPIAVVSDRPGGSRRAPGAAINEAEAIRALRRHLVSTGIGSECLVISSQGAAGGGYGLTALNRCEGTRLGRWLVDGKTGVVTPNH